MLYYQRWCLLFLCAFLLSGCTAFPKAYHLYPELTAQMKTNETEEIRRRWGDYSYFVDKRWIGHTSDTSVLLKLEWIVKGASASYENWWCSGDTCNRHVRVVQYNATEKTLDYLLETGSKETEFKYRTVRSDTVAPDGTVQSFWEDWKFDHSSETLLIGDLQLREASEQQYRETLVRLRAAAAANAHANARGRSEFWSGLATGVAVLGQASREVVETQTAQRVRTEERNRARQSAFDTAAAKEKMRIANEQAKLGRGGQQLASQTQTTYRHADARAKGAATQPPSRPQRTTMTPSVSSAASQAKPAPASRGPARAWCMQKKNGEYSCNGPLQNGGWGKSLQGALKMVDCTNGNGFTPTIGGGGERFNCGRDLRSGEQVMPAADPFRK